MATETLEVPVETPARVRLQFEMSPSLNSTLEEMARESGTTKAEIIRKAIALMEAAVEAKHKGNQVGIVDSEGALVTRIVGL